ncbi:hypothetical protein C7972_105221 [Arenibacter sp. ARW7G5Y1]|nr:hypothetical protein C7972_105221 [Arenibacter sp. ARW7G5Y1]
MNLEAQPYLPIYLQNSIKNNLDPRINNIKRKFQFIK